MRVFLPEFQFANSFSASLISQEALDEALKNTFPASDPVSVEQPTTTGRGRRS
jgi:hypothetical protein